MRIPQQWFTCERVAWMLEFSVATVREWVRQGRFGPPAGREAEAGDYVVRIGGEDRAGDVRISQRAVFHFLDANAVPVVSVRPVFARSEGELRRKVANG